MSILLMIGKVLLTILLILLLLILGILLLLLFCPFRYRVTGHLKEEITASEADGEVSWLFGAIGFGISFVEKQLHMQLRIFFWRKNLGDEDPEEEAATDEELKELEELLKDETDAAETEPENSKVQDSATSEEEHTDTTEQMEEKAAEEGQVSGESPQAAEEKADGEAEPEAEEIPEADTPSVSIPKEKGNLFAKVREVLENLHGKLDALPPKAEAACRKVEELLEKAQTIYDKAMEYIGDEGYRKALKHVIREVWIIVRSVLPRKMLVDIDYSAASPDLTGQILGLVSMLPAGYRFRWSVRPDFEAEKFYVQGDVALKGAIRLYRIPGAVIVLLLDPQIRRVIRLVLKLRKEKKSEK